MNLLAKPVYPVYQWPCRVRFRKKKVSHRFRIIFNKLYTLQRIPNETIGFYSNTYYNNLTVLYCTVHCGECVLVWPCVNYYNMVGDLSHICRHKLSKLFTKYSLGSLSKTPQSSAERSEHS